MKSLFAFILLFIFCLSCNNKHDQPTVTYLPKVVQAHAFIIPKSNVQPVIIPAKKPVIIPAGKPPVFIAPSNVKKAGLPKIFNVGEEKIRIPGQNGFAAPRVIPAVGLSVAAGKPEVVPAKDAVSRIQNIQNFSSFGKIQGLSSNHVNAITEDKKGNLWIATMRGGVSKYDGKNFSIYSNSFGITNYIRSVFEDSKGNIWFGTLQAGLSRYDGQSLTHYNTKTGYPGKEVFSFFEDRKGNIWIGSDKGLDWYDGKNFLHFDTTYGFNSVGGICDDNMGNIWFATDAGLEKFDGVGFTHYNPASILNIIYSLAPDKFGNLWIGSQAGLSKFDGKSFRLYTTAEGLSNKIVTGIQEDANGDMWFATYYGGANRFDGKYFTEFSEAEGISSRLTCVLKDKRENIWFGSEREGISRFNGSRITHLTMNEGLSDNWIRSILEDDKGNVWFGGEMDGVNVYDGKTFTVYTYKQGMMPNSVTASVQDRHGNIWFGHQMGICKFDGKMFYQFQEGLFVFSMIEDSKGNLWIGTFNAGLYKYDGQNFTQFPISTKIVSSIIEDKQGNIWFSTNGDGLFKYDGNDFTNFTTHGGLSDDFIYIILFDKNNQLWMGCVSNGVTKFDGRYFMQYTVNQGLASNIVRSIMEDRAGNLWFGTYNGISKLNKQDASSASQKSEPYFKSYTYEDGLTGIEVNNGKTMYEAKDGNIWIGTQDRLSIFHPQGDAADTVSPALQLTDINLFNEKIDWKPDTSLTLKNGVKVHDVRFTETSKWYDVPQHLNLAYDNNNLTFHYVGITTNAPKKVKYQYKLEGLDRTWSAITSNSEANYGNLPFGKYTFVVKAMNGDGYWSNESRYSFVIRPPWWHTWWAYSLFGITMLAVIYSVFRFRENRLRMRHEIVLQKHNVEELKMQALRAQMNPHFIFNSLHSINLFILENNRLQAAEYLTKFSRLIRLILHNSQESFIPLAKELEALELYLELESLRFEQRFQYNISVSNEIDRTLLNVPPLIIQPYVENAIWHGLMPKKDIGIIDIDVYQEGETILCKITDNGVGRKKSVEQTQKITTARKSIGMLITAERIALMQNDAPSDSHVTINDLILSDGSPGGTQVVIKIRATYD